MNDDEQQISSVNWNLFGILAAIVILMGVATYFLLPRLISKTETNVSIVKAIEGPIKVKPIEPGGKAVDHQDLLVVDILKGGTKGDGQTESLRPSAPSPEPPPVNITEYSTTKTIDKENKNASAAGAVLNTTTASDATLENANKSNNKQVTKVPKASLSTSPKEVTAKNKTQKKPVTKEKKHKDEPLSKTKERIIVIEGDAPLYMIQLAAFRSSEKASEMASILSQKHQSRLKGVDLKTMKVDTGSNGIFHRIVSAPLSRQDADKMCSILRRSGQDCFLRKYTTTSP